MTRMPRRLSALVLLVVVALAAAATRNAAHPATASGQLYTPAQLAVPAVHQGLVLGRIIRVRGRLQAIMPEMGATSGIIYGPNGRTGDGVFVLYGAPSPLLARVRRLPIVGTLLPLQPGPDQPLTGRMATFRLRVVPCRASAITCAFRSPDLELVDGGTP